MNKKTKAEKVNNLEKIIQEEKNRNHPFLNSLKTSKNPYEEIKTKLVFEDNEVIKKRDRLRVYVPEWFRKELLTIAKRSQLSLGETLSEFHKLAEDEAKRQKMSVVELLQNRLEQKFASYKQYLPAYVPKWFYETVRKIAAAKKIKPGHVLVGLYHIAAQMARQENQKITELIDVEKIKGKKIAKYKWEILVPGSFLKTIDDVIISKKIDNIYYRDDVLLELYKIASAKIGFQDKTEIHKEEEPNNDDII